MAINGCSGGSGYVAVTAGSESGWRKAQKMEIGGCGACLCQGCFHLAHDTSRTPAGLYHFRPGLYLASTVVAWWKNSEEQRRTAKSRHSNMPNREIKNEPQAKLKK